MGKYFKQIWKILVYIYSFKFILYTYVAVLEVTRNMAEYIVGSQQLQQPENVNFDPIIRGLKNDNFDLDQVFKENPFQE